MDHLPMEVGMPWGLIREERSINLTEDASIVGCFDDVSRCQKNAEPVAVRPTMRTKAAWGEADGWSLIPMRLGNSCASKDRAIGLIEKEVLTSEESVRRPVAPFSI